MVQNLEEELGFSREYIKKKYTILEQRPFDA